MTQTNRVITNGQELFNELVSHARSRGTTALYPPCVLDLADPIINHLVEYKDMEDLKREVSPLRQLAAAASRDISQGAVGRPYSTALVDLAIGLCDEEVGCPVVELARLLGFHEDDGLAFQRISRRWFIVSKPRFEAETGVAVRSPGGTFQVGLPVLSEMG